ncbi:MAG: hypothetical protein HY553_02865, partial [Elusimicrobia bacterium]|nr:hypothetical protein [Elusimicrobiota bacterium]
MSWRKAVAALLSAALVAFAPGLECWRVFAQEIVRPNIPVSPAGGAIGAAGASLPVAAPSVSLAPSVLTAPLGLPRSAIVVAPSRRTAAAPGTVVVRVAPAAGASPGAAAQSVAGAGGGSLLRSLLWRDAGAARPSEPTALGRSVERLSQPALSVPQGNSGENASAEADRDFAQRRGAPSGTGASEDVAPAATARPLGTTVAAAPVVDLQRPTVEARHSGPLAVEGPSAAAPLAIEPVRPLAGRSPAVPALEGAFGVAGQDVRYRSVVAPAAATAFAAAAWAVALAVPAALAWAGGALGVQSAMQAAQGTAVLSAAQALWTVVTYGTFGVAAGLALYAAVDVAFLATAVWAGRRVSEDEFHGAVRRALRELGLGPAAVAGLAGHAPGRGTIHAYRGGSIATRLSFGFTTPHGVYLRPELARFPWLLKRVLRHELYHFHQNRGRGPPAQKPEGMLASIAHEFGARLQEDFGGKWLRELKIGVLERVVREAQVSLSLPYDYDVVVVRPEKDTLRDPEEFKALSGGRAKVTEAGDLAELHARPNAARIIVAPGATQWLPQGEAEDAKKGRHLLERALRQLDDQYVLSKGLRSTASGNKKGAWRELEDLARKSRRSGDSDAERLQRLMSVLWRQVASGPLKDLAVLQSIGRLYGSLQDRGVLLLPFSADEPGVDLLFRLLNYWEGPDGGRLQVERISLPEGGHVLVARKVESRVNLWLKPRGGHAIAASTTNISRDPAKAPLAERILREAGFGDKELAEFKAAGVEVRHALGADIGDNRVFISVPKRKAKALKRYAERAGASIDASRGGYRVHLLDSGPMQNLPQTWKLRVEGEGGRIFDIDTGIDVTHPDFAGVINAMAEAGTPSPRVSSYDVTGEGDNDYIGHGTHKASISYANGTSYKGMAPKAEGRMGKVFTRDGFGASDGDIMAAA